MNTVFKQYVREIRKLLPCNARLKKRCIAELEMDVSTYLENKPAATLADLYDAFGTPQSIAESFLERMDMNQFSRKVRTKRSVVIAVSLAAAILVVVLGALAITYANDLHDFLHGYEVEFREELPSVVLPSPIEEH